MNLLQVVAGAAICYSAVFLGILLKRIAKEEIPLGKRYFQKMQLVLAMAVPLALLLLATPAAATLSLLYLAIWTVLEKAKKQTLLTQYLLFGVALGIASADLDTFTITASLVFLYGLPAGSLMSKNQHKRLIVTAVTFLVTTLVSVLFF